MISIYRLHQEQILSSWPNVSLKEVNILVTGQWMEIRNSFLEINWKTIQCILGYNTQLATFSKAPINIICLILNDQNTSKTWTLNHMYFFRSYSQELLPDYSLIFILVFLSIFTTFTFIKFYLLGLTLYCNLKITSWLLISLLWSISTHSIFYANN